MATIEKKYLDLEGLTTYNTKVKELINDKVAKETGTGAYALGAYKIATNKDGLVTETAALSYNDLQGQPTIGNGTLTLQVNGTDVGTFTANATDNKTLNIKLGDFGLKGAMHFVGTSTTDPTGFTGATVDGYPSFESGDVVLYNTKEFVYNGVKWIELGDEGSYALKTTTINGQPLSANVTLGAGDVGADPAGTAAGLIAELDVAEVAVNANETVATISEADGKIAVGKQAIQIITSQVTGLDTALAAKADASAVTAVEGSVTALQGSMANVEANIEAIQGAGYQTAAQVNGLIANATIEAGKVNGAVANAQYATQAGALVNGISLNVAGTTHTLIEGGEVVIDATTLGALTAVPVATNEALGGVKVGFTSAGTNYAVELDANNAAFVNVPVLEVAAYNGVGAISITANGANYDVAVAANGILTSMIADGQITTAKIAVNAVTEDKIASVSTDAFVQGDNELILNGGTAGA